MEQLLNDIGREVIITLLAAPIIMAATVAGRRALEWFFGDPRAGMFDQPLLTWNEFVYAVVITIAMFACVLLSYALVTRLFNIDDAVDWTAGYSLAVLLCYIVLSTGLGFLAQAILSAGKQLDLGVDTRENTLRRRRMFMSTLWIKLALLALFFGWALLASPGKVLTPTVYGLVALFITDVIGAILVMTVD